jgi:hypothetical protein
MFDRKDFVPKTLSVSWPNLVHTDSFDSAIAAANEWIEAGSIDVLNIETVVLPAPLVDIDDKTGIPRMYAGDAVTLFQFIRVWYRRS